MVGKPLVNMQYFRGGPKAVVRGQQHGRFRPCQGHKPPDGLIQFAEVVEAHIADTALFFRGVFRPIGRVNEPPQEVADLVGAVKKDGDEVTGIGLHQVAGNFQPLLFPPCMQFDPGGVLFFRRAFGGFGFQGHVHGQLTHVEAGQRLHLVIEVAGVAAEAQLPPGNPAGDDVAIGFRGGEHEGEVEDGDAHVVFVDHAPHGFGANVFGRGKFDLLAVGGGFLEEVKDAVVAGAATRHQGCPGGGR